LWLLDRLATRYHSRPSELCGLKGLDAYQLDEAVFTFCAGVQQKIDAVPEGRGKKAPERRAKQQQELLNRLLKLPEPERKFKDPAALLKG
jgi:hypothetical protein